MASNINALLDKAEDPEKMIDQYMRNLESDLGKVKAETAAVMAEETRAKRELDECTESINKMQAYAEKALLAGNEADARAFLEKKSELSKKLSSLQQTYDIAKENSTKMRAMHDKIVKDIGELNSRRDQLKAKMAVAETQEKLNKIGQLHIAKRLKDNNQLEEQVKKSNENFLEAQRQAALMLNGSRPVDLWRENNTRQLSTKGVKYRKFVRPISRNKYGHWIDDYVYAGNNIKFENIQLRLTKDKKLIETSKYASVPYDSAIKLWHKFIIWINSNRVAENPYFSFNNKNIKVGLYNLRFIRYCTKRTDNGKTIYNENGKPTLDWLIQIGCHSIWLTDVLDFINYYKLEKDFQTQYVLNPRVKPNINNNK